MLIAPSEPCTIAIDTFPPVLVPLWFCITAMIVSSGLVDFFLEYGYGGTLPSSIYEYFGGVSGGFQDPHTRLSAVFQVINALIVMILVAAYGQSRVVHDDFQLAQNWLLLSSGPHCKKTSVAVGTYGEPTLETVYPDVLFDTTVGGYSNVGAGLVDGTCKAAILPKVDFDTLTTAPANCELSVVGASLFSTAGWSRVSTIRCA